jgi:hypothetical protein
MNAELIKSVIILLVSSIVMVGCAQVSQVAEPADLTVDVLGFEQQKEELPTLVYIRPGAPTLEKYTKFIMEPIAINTDNQNLKEASMEDVVEMQAYLENAMRESLESGGYQLVSEVGEETLIIGFTIIDMQMPTSATNVSMLVVPGLSTSVGEVTVEATFTDSITDQLNAVVLESSRGSYMFNGNPLTTSSDIKAAFDNWATGFRAALDVAHGKAD